MLRIIENIKVDDSNVILMCEMQPLQVGKIVDDKYRDYIGHIVMRTASISKFEVMDLTKACVDSCWSNMSTIKVRLLGPDEVVHLEVYNS